ncbi:MAG TPA: CBS domain-containing protein, partial [Thermodesulfovibrionales bacterium]|nr:CBS domain-containing protein [Thermodesulfovibrionales bacterium]
LTLKDILKGLEPRVAEPVADTQAAESGQSSVWETLFGAGSKELAEKPISEIMTPARQFVEPEDPVTKAAYIMLHDDIVLVPVLEGKKKFVGLVRMIEVFDSVSDEILKG